MGKPRVEPGLLPIYGSMAECCGRVGVPMAVLKHAKAHDCDAFRSGGRVDLGLFLRWFFGRLGDATELPEGIGTWGEALNREKALREKIKRNKDEGKMMDYDEGRRQASEAMGYVFAELDRVAREISPIVGGRPVEDCYREITRAFKGVKANAKTKFDEVGEVEGEG